MFQLKIYWRLIRQTTVSSLRIELLPYFKLSTFRMSKKLQPFMIGRASEELSYKQVYIPCDVNNSHLGQLRICSYRPKETKGNAPVCYDMHGGG